MPLRATILAYPETLSDMLLAADDRYADGEELLRRSRWDGGVYLLGYAAEMWLKAACLRLRSEPPTVQVRAALPPLRTWMKLTAPSVPFTNYHDLSYWAECVIRLREAAGRPLPAPLRGELAARIVNGLHNDWVVDMRYRRSGLSPADGWSALNGAWWVKNNWVLLP